jgi:hypothetical protein
LDKNNLLNIKNYLNVKNNDFIIDQLVLKLNFQLIDFLSIDFEKDDKILKLFK